MMELHRRVRRKGAALLIAVCAALATGAAAANDVATRLQDWLDRHDSFRSRFSQFIFDENGRTISFSKGTVTIRRPLQFRWNYDAPDHQVIVSDGVMLWWYDADLEQVTVKRVRSMLGTTPAVFLARSRTIDESFRTEALPSADGLDWIKMIPIDPDAAFREIRVGMRATEFRRIEMADGFGQTTRVEFSRVEYDPPIEDALFRFEPPAGVDVIQGE